MQFQGIDADHDECCFHGHLQQNSQKLLATKVLKIAFTKTQKINNEIFLCKRKHGEKISIFRLLLIFA
jgi:hypothetical protein